MRKEFLQISSDQIEENLDLPSSDLVGPDGELRQAQEIDTSNDSVEKEKPKRRNNPKKKLLALIENPTPEEQSEYDMLLGEIKLYQQNFPQLLKDTISDFKIETALVGVGAVSFTLLAFLLLSAQNLTAMQDMLLRMDHIPFRKVTTDLEALRGMLEIISLIIGTFTLFYGIAFTSISENIHHHGNINITKYKSKKRAANSDIILQSNKLELGGDVPLPVEKVIRTVRSAEHDLKRKRKPKNTAKSENTSSK